MVSQVAVSSLLLVGTGLMLQTLYRSSDLDAGFAADDVIAVSADPSVLGYDIERMEQLWAEMSERAAGLPGVEAAALGLFVPLGSRADQVAVSDPDSADADASIVNYNVVSPGYFELLEIPLAAGRGFAAIDDRSRPDVAVVNRTFAERWWPTTSAVGRHVRVRAGAGPDRTVEIVGVVADIKYRSLAEPPTPFLYLPHPQWDRQDLVLHVRGRSGADSLIGPLAENLRAVDPELPVTVRPLRDEMAYSLTVPRIVALVLGVSGAVGLMLATMGVFAVVAYATARRIPEIGVRMTLGADAADIRRLVVLQGLVPTLWGLLLGLSAGAMAGGALASLLYGVHPADPVTLLVVGALLAAVSVLASYWPARLATAVDPAISLRAE